MDNDYKVTSITISYAVFGQNKEIIEKTDEILSKSKEENKNTQTLPLSNFNSGNSSRTQSTKPQISLSGFYSGKKGTIQSTKPQTSLSGFNSGNTETTQSTKPQTSLSDINSGNTETAQSTKPQTSLSGFIFGNTETNQSTKPQTPFSGFSYGNKTDTQSTKPQISLFSFNFGNTTNTQRTKPQNSLSGFNSGNATDTQSTEPQAQSFSFIYEKILSNKLIRDFPIIPSIKKHNNDLFQYILTSKNYETDIKKMLPIIFENNNICLFANLIKDDFTLDSLTKTEISELISTAATSGYYTLTKLFFELIINPNNKKIDNQMLSVNFVDSILFGNISILELYASLNNKDVYFKDAIIFGIINEQFEYVKYSLMFPFIQQYHLSNEDTRDIIKISIYKKNTNIFDFLIDRLGTKIIIDDNPKDPDDSFLAYACAFGNVSAALKIIDLCKERKVRLDYTTPFIYAATQRFDDICKYMIEQKVLINFSQIINKRSDLAKMSKDIMVSLLNTTNEEYKNMLLTNFLYEAINAFNIDLVEFLLDKNVPYEFALIKAVSVEDKKIVELVLKHDSLPSFINKISKNGTALSIAVKLKNIDIVKILLSISGIEPSINIDGETPLITAFSLFDIDIINLFFDFYGENIQAQIWQVNCALKMVLNELYFNYAKYGSSASSVIQKILEVKNIDYNYHINNYNLLTYACQTNQKDIAEKLLNFDDINTNIISNKHGITPLMFAVENNNLEMIKLLIQSGKVDINLRNYKNQTALTIAVQNQLSEIVDFIINDNSFDPKKSNIDYAFFLSTKKISKQLISIQDLNVNYINNDVDSNIYSKEEIGFNGFGSSGIIPFRYNSSEFGLSNINKNNKTSAWGNNISNSWETPSNKSNREIAPLESTLINAINAYENEKAEMIIHHQSFDPNISQITAAIFTAAAKKNVKIFNVLLPLINNDVNIRFQNDETLLVFSSRYGSYDIIKEIIKNPNFDSTKSEINAAFVQLLPKFSLWTNMLDFLLEHDKNHLINFSQLLPNGKSYFTVDSLNKTYNIGSVVSYLLSHGADPNLPDRFGLYPLQFAIESNNYAFAAALLDSKEIDLSKKINFSEKYDKYVLTNVTSTYLHLAIKVKNQIFKKIIGFNQIDINTPDSRGETPLMTAVRNKNYDAIRFLFENNNLDYLHRNNKNKDAFDIALSYTRQPRPKTRNEYLNTIIGYTI